MFGISPLGWLHTLSSLPAIPVAGYMFVHHGRIVPRSVPGRIYLVTMLMGAGTVFFVAREAAGIIIGAVTLLILLAGYSVGRLTHFGQWATYLETVFLSLTTFLLLLPAVSETLRRVPDGHPFVADMHAPLLWGVQAILLLGLIVGVTAQIRYLRQQSRFRVSI